MTAQAADPTFERWLDHPIIREIREQEPLASGVEILEALMGVLHDLDDRFPGLRLCEILDPAKVRPAKRPQVRQQLLELGIDPVDVDLICPEADAERHQHQPNLDLELARTGLTASEICAKYPDIGQHRARQIVGIRNPPTDLQRRLGGRVLAGESMRHVARDTGASINTVRWATYRMLYHQEVG